MAFLNRLFNRPPSQDAFATLVRNRIQKADETADLIYDPEQFSLSAEGGHRFYLANVHAEYCAASSGDRPKILKHAVRTWFTSTKSIPDEFEDARHDLLPAVRSRSYFDNVALMSRIEGNDKAGSLYQPLGEDLAIGLVYDLPDAMRSVGQGDLNGWNVTFYEALEAARENLKQLPCSIIGPEEGEGLYMAVTQDSYDASRLLMVDMIRQLRVKGDPVAMVPNRDTLLVAGVDDEEALTAMLTLAKQALEQPRIITVKALRLDGEQWVSWLPNEKHPLYPEFRLLYVQSCGQDYHEQKELLDALHEKTGIDVFVASYSAVQDNNTGAVFTYTVWSKDVPTLLPRTDRVAFNEDGKKPVMAPWDRVTATVGELMEPVDDMYPERFEVVDYPTGEQFDAMGAEPF
jgi:uncharacterized protein YtpQ (UPF0354 family)